jgi:tetratricopeptide (TPR) repeat protein
LKEALDLYYDARQFFIQRDYSRALSLLQQSLRTSDHFKSREMVGQCWERLGDWSRAVDEYRRALLLNPQSNKTAHLLASLLLDHGDSATARDIVRSILGRCPTYGPARRLLSKIGEA